MIRNRWLQVLGWRIVLALVLGLGIGVAAGACVAPQAMDAQNQGDVDWPKVVLTSPVSGLDVPVQITNAADGSGRIFIVEQRGRVRIVKNGELVDKPFLDIMDKVTCCGERGLLSIAFPPDYASNDHFYVNYTDQSGDTVVARYRLTADPDIANPESEEIVLTVDQPYANHNGGQLAFGPNDGFLYIGMGDGGSAGDPENRAQNPGVLLGKVLRVDVETNDPLTYSIPASNPYTQTVGYLGEIWALGLRNPWRFSFDQETGDLYIGDVGQGSYEEVDYQPASSRGGENYGWRIMEGSHCYKPKDCSPGDLVLPVVEYGHTEGNCSVTGGMVYRGTDEPRMDGVYFYADYCSGRIWGLVNDGAVWQSRLLYDAPFKITGSGVDEAGNVWFTEYSDAPNGAIHRLADARFAHLPLIIKPHSTGRPSFR